MPTTTTKKRATKKAPRKSTPRKETARKKTAMTASHKKALADGRTMSNIVDRYLVAATTPKARGRKLSTQSIEAQLGKLRAEAKQPGVKGLTAIQQMRDLEVKLAQRIGSTNGVDLKEAEAEFVKIAKKFAENRGIGYGAFRTAGVSPVVLKKAGIARTRSA